MLLMIKPSLVFLISIVSRSLVFSSAQGLNMNHLGKRAACFLVPSRRMVSFRMSVFTGACPTHASAFHPLQEKRQLLLSGSVAVGLETPAQAFQVDPISPWGFLPK